MVYIVGKKCLINVTLTEKTLNKIEASKGDKSRTKFLSEKIEEMFKD